MSGRACRQQPSFGQRLEQCDHAERRCGVAWIFLIRAERCIRPRRRHGGERFFEPRGVDVLLAPLQSSSFRLQMPLIAINPDVGDMKPIE